STLSAATIRTVHTRNVIPEVLLAYDSAQRSWNAALLAHPCKASLSRNMKARAGLSRILELSNDPRLCWPSVCQIMGGGVPLMDRARFSTGCDQTPRRRLRDEEEDPLERRTVRPARSRPERRAEH